MASTAGKRKSRPVSPADSPVQQRLRTGSAAAAAPKTLVTVEPPEDGHWATSMRRGREAGEFIDIVLVVDGRKIHAHRNVLASLSPYLHGLLTSGLAESTVSGDEMPIGDESTDGAAVEAIVDCMYSGKIAISTSTVSTVIRAANMLQVGAVEKAACDFLIGSLEPASGVPALGFAAQFSECGEHARELHEQCLRYAAENFADCSREASFAELSCETVCKLIASESLFEREEIVLAAARRWFEHDVEVRKGSLKDLVPLIRWPLLPVTLRLGLAGEQLLMHLMDQNRACRVLGASMLIECGSDFAASDAAATCPRLKPRQPRLTFVTSHDTIDTTREAGALAVVARAESSGKQAWRTALCNQVMNAAHTFYAEATCVDNMYAPSLMFGLARAGYDPASADGVWRNVDVDGWMYSFNTGLCLHDRKVHVWANGTGKKLCKGDTLGLRLRQGNLGAYHNGEFLGVLTTGLRGDFVWAVDLGQRVGNSVRIACKRPPQ